MQFDTVGLAYFPGVGRAVYIRQLSKALLEELHQEERKIGRTLSPKEIRLTFPKEIERTGEMTTKECEEVYSWAQKVKPKWSEERECEKCIKNWKLCDKLQNDKCFDYYTDLEFQHAWDFGILFNCPKFEVGFLAPKGRGLISKLGQLMFLF